MKIILYGLLLLLTCSCATVNAENSEKEKFSKSSEFHKKFIKTEFQEFARANCIYQYFKNNKYDVKAARSVTGQLLQMGSYGTARYTDVANLVKNYHPKFLTVHKLDIELFKCFIMMSDKDFIDELIKIKNKKYSKSDY
jgi:hypothetical protein